jgi:three-Cys-motif partner protein
MAKPGSDPSDGLPAIEAQEWAEEKHAYLRRYLHISFAARRKFLSAGGSATYTELFCGPGRLLNKTSGQFIDGSPLVAYKESIRTKTGFTMMHLADEQAKFCKAAEQRLVALGAKVKTHPLKSDAAARRIVRELDDAAINVAFLDPFSLGALPFSVIETFATLRKIDLIIHVSAMDLIRQLPGAMGGQATTLDNFAPGWRSAVTGLQPGEEARGKFIEYWLGLIRKLGYEDAVRWRLIRGPTNQPLYWLVLVAKHGLAAKFWDKSSSTAQGDLFNGN